MLRPVNEGDAPRLASDFRGQRNLTLHLLPEAGVQGDASKTDCTASELSESGVEVGHLTGVGSASVANLRAAGRRFDGIPGDEHDWLAE